MPTTLLVDGMGFPPIFFYWSGAFRLHPAKISTHVYIVGRLSTGRALLPVTYQVSVEVPASRRSGICERGVKRRHQQTSPPHSEPRTTKAVRIACCSTIYTACRVFVRCRVVVVVVVVGKKSSLGATDYLSHVVFLFLFCEQPPSLVDPSYMKV